MAFSVGERLKAAREQKGIVMEEACRATKIQRKILEGIEGDRLQGMLDPAYARIFLKKYAGYLGLDGAAIVQEYLSTPGMPSQPQGTATAGPVGGAAPRGAGSLDAAELRPVLAAVGAGLAALVGVGFLVYLGLDLAGNLREGRRAPPPPRSGAPGAAAGERAAEKQLASRPLLVPLSKKLQLTVQTSANVWLQVKADGSVVFQNVLSKGAKESWTAQRELELWTGNAGAMALTLNGRPLEGVGRGVRKGIRITHSGMEQP